MVALAAAIFMVLAVAATQGNGATSQTPAAARGGLLLVPLPKGVSREQALTAGRSLREQLTTTALQAVAQRADVTPASGPGGERPVDRVVELVDAAGEPVLPDAERVTAPGSDQRAADAAATDITFTFDSPDYPWTAADVATIQSLAAAFMPVLRQILGDPAFSLVVNVRRDPTISNAGLYFPSTNEMVLKARPDASTYDVFVHELAHAFRDDYIMGLSTWEEGMTRAAEIEAFDLVGGGYVHSTDQAHSYGYDVYYEGLNVPTIGSRFGNLYSGALTLLRYQLSGYAWGKALIENPGFLRAFDSELYVRAAADLTTLWTEAKLVAIAAAVQPTVEGTPFTSWYVQQGVLDTAPPYGDQLYHRINQYTVDFFRREASGGEVPYASVPVGWSVFDALGALVDSGSTLTAPLGWINFWPDVPAGYQGRLDVSASAVPPGGTSITAMRSGWWGVEDGGVFGVVPGAGSGFVTIAPLDGPAAPVTVPVVNGGFSAPTLADARGRFEITFSSGATTFGKRFTKDASRYLVYLEPPRVWHADLVTGDVYGLPAVAHPGDRFSVGETTYSVGADTAGPSFTSFWLSADAVRSADDVSLGTFANPSLGHGESLAGVLDVTFGPVPPGVYRLLACADGTGLVDEDDETNNCEAATDTVTVVVQDFTLAASPSSRTVTAGGSVSYSVTVIGSGGFSGAVSLSFAGVPAGASASFTPNPATSVSTLALTTTTSTPAGSYTLAITGTSDTLTHTTQAMLVVQAPPPANTGLPVISGSAVDGQLLSASTGVWSGSPTGYAYEWRRCDVAGAGCVAIGGAVAASYTLAAADVGHTVRVAVTASNGAGSATAVSAQTVVVAAAAGGSFGQSQVGTLVDAGGAGYLDLSGPYAVSGAVSVSQLNGYMAGGSAASRVRGVIYTNSSGQPGILAAVSTEVSLAANRAAAWVVLPLASPVALAAGSYWLGYWYADKGGRHYYLNVAGAERYKAAAYSATGNPPASFGSASSSSSSYSLTAVYSLP